MFGDQQANSALLVSRGCGIALDPKAFTAADVTRVVSSLLADNAVFAARAGEIQASLLPSGGAPLAVSAIEGVVRHGVRHLVADGESGESALGRVGARARSLVWLALAVLPGTAALFLRCAVRLRQAASR